MLVMFLFGLLTTLVFVAFRDGTRTFANLSLRQGLEGDARRCAAVLEQQIRQSDFTLLALQNGSNRQRMGASGATVSRDGLCYPGMARWWDGASFDARGRPQWDQYEVIYATLFNPGKLVRQVYRPAGAPYSQAMDPFTVPVCLNDDPKDNVGARETHVLSQLVEDFQLRGEGQTSSLNLRLILTQRANQRAGANTPSQERLQIDLAIKLNNTEI